MAEKVQLTAKTSEAKRENSASKTRKIESPQSMSSTADKVLYLQRTIGNQAVQRLIKSGALQAKLKIGQPGDRYEQEADKVADQMTKKSEIESHIDARNPKALTFGNDVVALQFHHINQKSGENVVQLKPATPSPKMEERIIRIEKLIAKNWKKYVDKSKFKSPLKDRIVWYENAKELYSAKFKFARQLAVKYVNQLEEKKKKELFEKHKGMVTIDKPTFEQVKPYIINSLQVDYFLSLGGREVPAFFNHINNKIYTSSDGVGVIAHEALHYYGSREFREVLGADIDEGMTQYLTEQIEHDYMAKYSKEVGIILSITEYTKNVELIKLLIKSRKLEKNETIKSYFKGGKTLLRKIKTIIKKSKVSTKQEKK
jgi:hypothetical protein